MKRLQRLFEDLDLVTQPSMKVRLIKDYLEQTPKEDLAWVLYFFQKRRLSTRANPALLKSLVKDMTCWPADWIEKSHEQVKDLPETLALLLPHEEGGCELSLSNVVIQFLKPLAHFSPHARRETIRCAWRIMNTPQRVLFNKMLLGHLRCPVSTGLWIQALAQWSQLPEPVVAHRLSLPWEPSATEILNLFKAARPEDRQVLPYPLASIGEEMPLSHLMHHQAPSTILRLPEGIHAQIVRRKSVCQIWSEAQEPLSASYPELLQAAQCLPSGTVVEGVIAHFHPKMGDKTLPSNRRKAHVFHVHDLLEYQGKSLLECAWKERARSLQQLMEQWTSDWQLLGQSPDPSRVNPDCVQQEMFQPDMIESPEKTPAAPEWPICMCQPWEHPLDEKPKPLAVDETICLVKEPESLYPDPAFSKGWPVYYPNARITYLTLWGAIREEGRIKHAYSDYLFAAESDEGLVVVGNTKEGWDEQQQASINHWIHDHAIHQKGPLTMVETSRHFKMRFLRAKPSSRASGGLRLEGLKALEEQLPLHGEKVTQLEDLKAFLYKE